jgi:hypothetical protein
MQLVAKDMLEKAAPVSLTVMPLEMRLIAGEARPLIEVVHRGTSQRWEL